MSRTDEIGEVAKALDQMAEALQTTLVSRDELVREVSERKAAQENLIKLTAALRRQTAELRDAQDQLLRKERLAAVGQLTATISHELRNPLGTIRSASDAIKKLVSGNEPQLGRAIALLERSQTRCDRIIEDLLNYTRIGELNRGVTQVDDWLKELLAEYDLPAGVVMRRELKADIKITFDPDRLERAVRNVIDNACHAMAGNGEDDAMAKSHQLIVATRATEQRLELSIKDTGPGIAPAEQARIFEPLFSTKAFGVGLGLPIVKQIMEQHNGGIEIHSELGRGTEVVLWLPRSAPEQGAAA